MVDLLLASFRPRRAVVGLAAGDNVIVGVGIPRIKTHGPRMTRSYLPTVIVRHPKENPRKCSILPLRGRDDIVWLQYPPARRPPLDNYVRLAAEGPPLTLADQDKGILLLDGSWRWAEAMTRTFADVPPRSLRGYHTAYPRVSKQGTDPDNGLASVEALYLAYYLLQRPTEGLLDAYHWTKEFLDLNGLTS